MSEAPDTGGEQSTGGKRDASMPVPAKRSLARMLLWSSVDLDNRDLSPDLLGVAAGITFASAIALLYFLGEGWSAMRTIQSFTIMAGLAVGVAGTYDVITRRPVQLLVPFAHLLGIVLLLTLAMRFGGYREHAHVALAWSLGLHLCLLPLSTRLWAIFFNERASGQDVTRRRRMLDLANSGEDETLLIRVLETEPGFTEAEIIGEKGKGVLRLQTFLLSPRPRPGLVYVLSRAVVINRSVPGSEERGHWVRYAVSVGEAVLLGERAEITEPAESAELARRALGLLAVLSLSLTGLAAVAAL